VLNAPEMTSATDAEIVLQGVGNYSLVNQIPFN